MKKQEFKIHSIQYNFIMNIILKMSAFVFPLISFPYVSRVLGASGNGKIAFAASVVNYFSLFALLGIPSYGVKACAQVRDNKEKLSTVVQELLVINFCSMAVSYIVFIGMMLLVPELRNQQVLLWINSISILLSSIGVEWFYQAIEQYDYITFRNIAFKFISIILMFVFVKKPTDYIIYAGITIVGTYGSNILNVLRLPRYISLKKTKKYSLVRHLAPIIALFLYNAATTIYTNLDTVMLGMMTNDNQVGYYNAAVKIKGILASVVTAMSAVLLPRVSYYLSNDNREDFFRIIKKTFQFVLIISIPLAVFFVLAAKPTITILAGEEYLSSIVPMQIITPAIIFIGIGSITAWQMLIPLGMENVTVVGAVVGALVDLILNFLLIPRFGASGAAIGTLIAEVSVVCVHFFALRNELKHITFSKELIKIIISALISSLVFVLLDKLLFEGYILIRLSILAVSYFICYYLFLLIVKEKITIEYTRKIIVRFSKRNHS